MSPRLRAAIARRRLDLHLGYGALALGALAFVCVLVTSLVITQVAPTLVAPTAAGPEQEVIGAEVLRPLDAPVTPSAPVGDDDAPREPARGDRSGAPSARAGGSDR
ncbi:MAG: hypothetical protein JHD04_01065, partial [Nocardioides sp.]|nr:hypothetical protein [Nocardioides sp.]